MTLVLGKVRPTTHRGNRSASEPLSGLSDGRLALVQRYMIDAEEAEARARPAAEKNEAHRRIAPVAAGVREQAQSETAEPGHPPTLDARLTRASAYESDFVPPEAVHAAGGQGPAD